MKYRSRTEIIETILDTANGGASKTNIMYKAFLSYTQLREYLSMLVDNNLLSHDDPKIYRLTEKGLNYLRMSTELGHLLQTIRKDYS
ncbi:MAG: winged helix-turn-helix domain-containing protein [Nitrososphaeraceae archaeon]